ncbi:MAG TPA: hypothetical protein VFK78_05735 [Gemmatimonadales bacterium]|nr:hypothetical protein [Gemmatimonadales bacterium]
MRVRSAVVGVLGVVASFVLVPPARAQQPPYGGQGGERGRSGMGDGRSARRLPTEDQLQGPPDPGFVADRFELDTAEAVAYQQVYDSFMAVTEAERDTALSGRRTIQAAFERRDFAAARGDIPLVLQLGDDLDQKEKRFDERVKQVLSSKHFKAYRDWKDDQRKQAEKAADEEMQRRRGGSGPGSR